MTAPTGPADPTGLTDTGQLKPRSLIEAENEMAAKADDATRAQEAERAEAERAEKSTKEQAEKLRTSARTPDQIRADIEATRRELGATVDALSAKLDVKSRTQSWVQDPANRPQLIAAGVALASVLALVILKKVRS